MILDADHVQEACLIVRAGTKQFALPAHSVRAIAPLPKLTKVPLAPAALMGLASVRGDTLAVLSLATLTESGSAEAFPAKSERQLLVLDEASRSALAVDRVERLERTAAGRLDETSLLAVEELLAAVFPARAAEAPAVRSIAKPSGSKESEQARIALLRFEVGGQRFALPLENVIEIMRVPHEITPVPRADAAVLGSAIWRGKTLGLFSLDVLLGLEPDPDGMDRSRRILVVEIGFERLGLLVERVEAVVRVPQDRIDPVPPSLIRSESEARITAVCRLEASRQLMSVLAVDQLLSDTQTRKLLGSGRADTVASDHGGNETVALLPVRFGNVTLAVPLSSVRQVAPLPAHITRIPGAPDWLAGMALVGGEPCAIVDQVLRLTATVSASNRARLLVAQLADTRIGFIMSATDRILHVDVSKLASAPLPDTLAGGLFGQVLQLGGKEEAVSETKPPLLVVEPSALISLVERDLLTALLSHRPAKRS